MAFRVSKSTCTWPVETLQNRSERNGILAEVLAGIGFEGFKLQVSGLTG